jgi:hypothetical protein
MRALAFALVMTLSALTARAEPLMLLWDTDYGPWLLEKDVAVLVVTVERVTTTGGKSMLHARVERALRGGGDARLELGFMKLANYRRPIDKARAIHDQWQELPFAAGDWLVFLMRAGAPLAVLPTAKDAPELDDLTAILDTKVQVAARVADAVHGARAIREAFARAGLNDKNALTRLEKAKAIAGAMIDPSIPPDEKSTWSLYTQGVFDAKHGADAANVEVIRGLLVAAAGGQDVSDLLEQFLLRDMGAWEQRHERDKLVQAISRNLRVHGFASLPYMRRGAFVGFMR